MKKRILLIESRYDSFYGAQKSMVKLIDTLDKSMYEAKVLTTGYGKLQNELKRENIAVDVIKLGSKANVFGGQALAYSLIGKFIVFIQLLIYNLKLVPYVRKNNFDVIYVNDIRSFLYSVVSAKLLKKKVVWYIRADVSNSFLTRLGFKFCDSIITIAHGVLRNIPPDKVRKYKYKIKNIYTGFDFENYIIKEKNEAKKDLDIDSNKIVVGYLGSINPRKGIDLLIDSLIKVNAQNNNIELLIAGDVSKGYESYWENILKKINESNISYRNIGYQTNVNLIYSAMDVLVLPSKSEGLPRTVIEGMAHRLAVISTDVGGTKEIIENEKLGYLITNGSVSELVKALNLVIKNSELREEIGKQAAAHVKEKFDERKFKKNINNFFMNI